MAKQESEDQDQESAREGLSPSPSRVLALWRAVSLLRESRVGMLGIALVMFWVVLSLLAPLLPLFDPLYQYPCCVGVGPGSYGEGGEFFILGTDDRGRDLMSRLVWGGRLVLFWAAISMVVAYVVGGSMGLAAGYIGGLWDGGLSFLANVLLSFPVMVMYLLVITFLGGASGVNVVFAVTFATSPAIFRIVRGLILDIRTRDYVFAAQVRGESSLRIMLAELLPNVRGPLIVDMCLRLGYTTITIALLGYLGIGLPPPAPNWGTMISDAQQFGHLGVNGMIWPAIAISTLVLGLNLFADGLREVSLRD